MQKFVCYTNCYILFLEKRVTYIGYKSVVFLFIQPRSNQGLNFHQHVLQPSYQPKEITTKIGIAKKGKNLPDCIPPLPNIKQK